MNRTVSAPSLFRFAQFLMAMMLSALLAACGGGGGKVGLPTGVALFTNAPASVTLTAGANSTYTIGGGNPTYSASSSNRDVATVTVSGTSVTITAVASGTASITVSDAVGASVNVPVSVNGPTTPTPPALFSTAPSAVTLAPGATGAYAISGGTQPYTVVSSNAGVARVALSGTSFVVTAVAAGSAQMVITDAAGTTLSVAVTVASAGTATLFTTAPDSVSVGVGGTAAYRIGGGTPAYDVASSNTAVARVAINGSDFIVTGLANGLTQVQITDAVGDVKSFSVTVGTGGNNADLFTTAPAGVSVAVGATATYGVGGGRAPYAATSSNVGVARVTLSGTSFVITGQAAGSAQIVVTDADGKALTVAVAVGSSSGTVDLFTTAPPAVNVAIGATASFSIGGGRPAYAASSSDMAVVRVARNGSDYTLTGVGSGTAAIQISDSDGAVLVVTVTVGAGAGGSVFYTTVPESVTIGIGASGSYLVGGGSPAYAASSSNTGVAQVTLVGGNLTITGVAPGTASVVVADSAGARATIAVTVSQAGISSLAVSPENATGNVGDTLTFLMSGGTAPYTVTMSNPSIATSTTSGSSFNALLLNAGSTSATVVDALGQSRNVSITAEQRSTVLRISPNALLVAENSTNTIVLNIYGGTPPYRAFTGSETLSAVSIVGSTMLVAVGTNTTRCVDTRDDTGVYVPNGIFDVTVTALDSLGASATAVLSIKDNGQGVATGCP